MQAEKVRVPYANIGLVKIPDDVTDDQAIMISDIFPTAYFGAENAEITDGDTVAVFGCGPVGQFAIASAFLLGAGRVLAIDRVKSRLEMAQDQGAEILNFEDEDPVEAIREFTGGIGVDRVIDAVGVDSEHPSHGNGSSDKEKFNEEVKETAPDANPSGDLWNPGSAPSQTLRWSVDAIAKAGTLSIIGVYPPNFEHFPIGKLMNKNLTLKAGNCNHRTYIPLLLSMVNSGEINPEKILTNIEPLTSVIDAYKSFDKRNAGWIKVVLEPELETA